MSTTSNKPILVTGAAPGQVGSVGFKIVELLREKGANVRAMVHRIDERSDILKKLGVEVVAGDLTNIQDVQRVMNGCNRVYFGMSVSASYLEATANVAAVAKHLGIEVLVNISQMTVSQMSLTEQTPSQQQRLHWLSEQVLNWSGVPVVHVRATVFLEHFFFNYWAKDSIKESKELILPLGSGKTSPIATIDVASVIAEILLNPSSHIGKVYELTGRASQNLEDIAKEYSAALGFTVKPVNLSLEEWKVKQDKQLKALPIHVMNHILTMAALHRDGRYDRQVNTVEEITGRKSLSIQEWVSNQIADFQ
jgi:NAD(P)H dehydrogenase (quinone)